jgi:SAM-dependent methyltransferase
MDFEFDLSGELFSSADVDRGTKLLLKVFSAYLDEGALPSSVLDAGCGAGIIGVCASRALGCRVRCTDRDALAAAFTLHNAALNGAAGVEAEASLLLPPGEKFGLILSNLPAKAGKPVLADFILRSPALLHPGGRVIIVVVNTLADFIRGKIAQGNSLIAREEKGTEHTVFVYGGNGDFGEGNGVRAGNREQGTGNGGFDATVNDTPGKSPGSTSDSLTEAPFPAPRSLLPSEVPTPYSPFPCIYLRNTGSYSLEGTSYRLDTFYGAADFDSPGLDTAAAAKLAVKLGAERFLAGQALVYGGGQGHFPVWLTESARRGALSFLLSGRNVISLLAAEHNLRQAAHSLRQTGNANVELRPAVFPAAAGGAYGTAVIFPGGAASPEALAAFWALPGLASGGLLIAAMGSSAAERFDRLKPPGFTRLGRVKRGGFTGLGYILG